MISQGEIWWADLSEPRGSAPGFRRPVVVVQGDEFNRSNISTVVCVPLTGNLKWATQPGNVELSKKVTGLPKDSVANVSAVTAVDKIYFMERAGRVPPSVLVQIFAGIDMVFDR